LRSLLRNMSSGAIQVPITEVRNTMTSDDNTNTWDILKQLALQVRAEINKTISEASLSPREEMYYRTQIEEFEYGEKGAKVGRRSGQYITKKTYHFVLPAVIKSVRESDEYSAAADALVKAYADENLTKVSIWGKLINLINELANYSLPDSTLSLNQDDVNRYLMVFLKRLQGEPVNYTAEVELTRVVILTPEIKFDADGFESVFLRQVTVEDLEQEFPEYKFRIGDVKPYTLDFIDASLPSTILTIECTARHRDELAERIKQSVAILRLFGTAGVDIISHCVYSEPGVSYGSFGSLNPIFSGIDRYLNAFGRYRVTEENTNKLITFWQELAPRLPEDFFKIKQTKVDYLTIAYERYCDALLRTRIFEARIANAVMGLEALLLPDSFEGELNFRLRIYAAKVLGILGYDPADVKDDVKLAYRIRSVFVHGGRLSVKDRKKVLSRYTNLMAFSERILDYLRVATIIAMMVKMQKQDFLALVDDSLISEQKSKKLVELLEPTRQLL
jgi:hypothetical protein